jgi:hypothetical protein
MFMDRKQIMKFRAGKPKGTEKMTEEYKHWSVIDQTVYKGVESEKTLTL